MNAEDIVGRLYAYDVDGWEAAGEIERLRKALALAVRELSSHLATPDEDQVLVQRFLDEADRL